MRFLLLICMFLFCLISIGCKEPTNPDAAKVDDGPQEMERVKAEAGVGKQGQIIGDKEGIIRTPIKTYFTVKQKVAFEFKVKPAVNLYEAEHGFKPKTHEEFMSKIIEFNKIELPELPAGQTYVWDPELGELMVERPKEN